MISFIKSYFNSFKETSSNILESYERLTLIILRKLSTFRYIFYSSIFCLISYIYSSETLFHKFGVLFIFASIFAAIINTKKVNTKYKKCARNLLQGFIIASSVIMVSYIAEGMKFMFINREAICNLTKLMFVNQSPMKKLFLILKLLSIPASVIFTVLLKQSQYLRMPDYKNDVPKVNIFDSSILNCDIGSENLKIPYSAIFSILVNLLNSGNKVSLLVSVVDILTGFIDFSGHKKRVFLYPMMFVGLVSTFMGIVNFCETVKQEFNLDQIKNTY